MIFLGYSESMIRQEVSSFIGDACQGFS